MNLPTKADRNFFTTWKTIKNFDEIYYFVKAVFSILLGNKSGRLLRHTKNGGLPPKSVELATMMHHTIWIVVKFEATFEFQDGAV